MVQRTLPDPFATDLLLVFPPFQRLFVSLENVGIEYISASARARGSDACIINAGLHGLMVDDIIRIIQRSRFKVLALSTLHWTMEGGLRIAKAARSLHRECHIILGGLEASLNAKAILRNYPYIDSIGTGEGELVVSELLGCLAKGSHWRNLAGLTYCGNDSVIFTKKRPLIDPLDSPPFPARDDLAAVKDGSGSAALSSSRGCHGRCVFCSVRALYARSDGPCWRSRSPGSVVSEILQLHENEGVRLLAMIDETVIGPGEKGIARMRDIAPRIREAGKTMSFFMTVRAEQVEIGLFRELKKAGLKKVEIGIESMVEAQLRRYQKSASKADNLQALAILEELGILTEVFMIPFDPFLTSTELKQNLSFYRRRLKVHTLRYDVAPLTIGDYLYPYPGTEAREIYEKQGWDELGFSLSVSLDGPPKFHDRFRPLASGEGSYGLTARSLKAAACFPTRGRMTVRGTFTRKGIHFFLNVKYLVEQDFTRNISYEPVFLPSANSLSIRWQNLPAVKQAYTDTAKYYVKRLQTGRAFCFWDFDDAVLQLLQKRPRLVRCGSGVTSVAITAEGNFFGCHMSTSLKNAWIGSLDRGFAINRKSAWENVYLHWKPGCSQCGFGNGMEVAATPIPLPTIPSFPTPIDRSAH